jgi:hypothetical protein
MVYGAKRHVEFVGDQLLARFETEPDPDFDATEANLGRTYVDPPHMQGRVAVPDGYRRWSMAAVRREVDFALAKTQSPDAMRPPGPAPWDDPDAPPFPALLRLMVKTPAMADALPDCVGAGPGTRYIQAEVDLLQRGRSPTPVALDPGGDLSSWQHLGWVDLDTGRPLRVTTDPDDPGVRSAEPGFVLIVSLDHKARDWSRPPHPDSVTEVVVTSDNVRHVGRASGVLDAVDDGAPGDLADYQPRYRVERSCACGCGESFTPRRADQRFASDAHRDRARKRRQRARPCQEGVNDYQNGANTG